MQLPFQRYNCIRDIICTKTLEKYLSKRKHWKSQNLTYQQQQQQKGICLGQGVKTT